MKTSRIQPGLDQPTPLPAARITVLGRMAPHLDRRWLVAGIGLVLLHLGNPLLWHHAPPGWWFPPVGVGLVLVAWLGWRAVFLVFCDALLVAAWAHLRGTRTFWGDGWLAALGAGWDALLVSAEVLAAWWCYHRLGGGSRRLGDPRSATLFLIVVPSLTVGSFALLRALPAWLHDPGGAISLPRWAGMFWLSDALGILTVAPPLLATLTPWLVRHRLADAEPPSRFADADAEEPRPLHWGDVAEIGVLALLLAVMTLVQAVRNANPETANTQLWGVPLLVIVWASLRHGLRGGTVVASSAVGAPLLLLGLVLAPSAPDPFLRADYHPQVPIFQANLLAQCATALLAAAAANWIRLSEARYRRVVTRIPVVLYSARVTRPAADGRGPPLAELVFVSPAARTLLGAPPEALLGDYAHWLGRVHPEDQELLLAALAQLARQAEPVTCEYRLSPWSDVGRAGEAAPPPDDRHSSGVIALPKSKAKPRWVRDTLAPQYGPAGELEGWDGVISDITEQRALADDLRHTTSLFHALVANLPAGVFFVQGRAGQPILVNARARQLLGRREDPAAGLSRLVQVYRLCRPDGTPYPTDELPVALALRDGTTGMRDDIVVHRPDGRRVPLITWAAPIDLGGEGRHDAAVWVFEDLTALRQAEEARREAVETLPIMLVQFDEKGALTYMNPSARAVTGYSPDELRAGATWEGLAHADDLPRVREALARALAGETARLELRYRAKDGSEKVGYVLVEPRRQDDRIAGATALIVDMTRERQLEADLQRAQRLELIGRLASGIAHDFNNLLTVVLTLAELARNSLPEGHPTRDDLQRIAYAGEQAANLAHQLLAFSKQRRARPARIDVNRVARRTLELLKATLPKTIHIEPTLSEAELPVQADEMQVQQVLMNLCLNARDAMPHGGRLEVRTSLVPCPLSLVPGNEPGTRDQGPGTRDWVHLSVQDDGEGIPEDVQGRIFDAFFTTKERGTGLGLAMVRQIVEGFGGRVEVRSKPGEGARFDVWLPREGGAN